MTNPFQTPPTPLKPLALAAALCLTGALPAHAQQTSTLGTVTVTSTPQVPVKTDEASSAKFTAPLVDTPKTVQIINEELIRQTGATSLQDALRSAPGITFGNGEGGNPSGDQPFIRGMDAQSSTFVDGMRDIAAGTREIFNLEAVEVIKGADSAFAGRGGAGGSINLVTKKARNENFIYGDLGLGTDSYRRATVDVNRVLGQGIGFRLNAMAHHADVPGRNGPENERWGIAPTVSFGLGTPTEVSLSWQHLKTDNVPDGGVPYLYSGSAAARLPGGSRVSPTYGGNRENWYGLYSRDYEKEKSDLLTATVEHKFSDALKFRNSLRFSKSEQDYVWTQPDDSKGNAINGFVWRRGNFRQSEVKTLQNLSEFSGKAQTGTIDHRFAIGLELSKERSDIRSGAIQDSTTTPCTAISMWCASLTDPDSSVPWTYAYTRPAVPTVNKIDTVALYAFDTLKFNEQWLLNAGIRIDHYDVKAKSSTYDISRDDTLFNYQVGVVYKPATNGSVYASLGTSSRPGGATLGNGSEDLSITTDALAGLSPERTRAIELGTKWDVLDKRLGLTAALFRNEVTNVRITENGITYMGGNKQVDGIELGVAGRVLPGLSMFGGYTYMDSEQKDMGAGAVANGQMFPNTPRHSFSLWTTYQPIAKLTVGLGIYAQSRVNQGYTRSTVDGGVVTKGANGYTRYDAMMAYQINRNLTFQLNGYNLGDKVYYSGVRSPHYATIASGRAVVASLKLMY
ncbi:MAG: TonB-dependent siderophore receptor [Burkholderiaceae bacterium]